MTKQNGFTQCSVQLFDHNMVTISVHPNELWIERQNNHVGLPPYILELVFSTTMAAFVILGIVKVTVRTRSLSILQV